MIGFRAVENLSSPINLFFYFSQKRKDVQKLTEALFSSKKSLRKTVAYFLFNNIPYKLTGSQQLTTHIVQLINFNVFT